MSGPPGANVVETKSRRKRRADPATANTATLLAPDRRVLACAVLDGPFVDDDTIAARHERRDSSFEHFLCKSFPEHRRPAVRPLANSSNFCYLNAVTQALAFVPPFAHACSLSADEIKFAPVLSAFGTFLRQRYWRGAGSAALVAPRLPSSIFGCGTGRQEDACEFLALLLSALEKELQILEDNLQRVSSTGRNGDNAERKLETATPVESTGKGWITVGKKKSEKLVVRHDRAEEGNTGESEGLAVNAMRHPSQLFQQIFGGSLANMVRGGRETGKSVTSVTYEPFTILPIGVAFAARCTVDEALIHSFQQETVLDDARGVEMKKSTVIEGLPQTLVLQVRRWAVTGDGEVVKLDNQLTFDRPDGTRLVVPQACCARKLPPSQRSYRLLAAVCHRGNEAQKGHYVTYLIDDSVAKKVDCSPSAEAPSVVLCNDSTIAPNATLKHLDRESAYLLFYAKRTT